MAKTKASDRAPDLREFVKEYDQRVYDFCAYLLSADFSVEDLVLAIFRDFGEYYRSRPVVLTSESARQELRVHLFQFAWSHVQNALHHSFYPSLGGRDTRLFKGMDDDILPNRLDFKEKSAARSEGRVRDRLARVDAELRAPVILRDILKFEDEQVARILGLRWGVYRHRLHRGRLDFKDALKGLTTGQPVKGATAIA